MEEENKIVPETKTGDEGKTSEPSQKIVERTPEEIAAYNLRKKAEDAKALGIDPKKVLGIDDNADEPPAWYKKEKSKEATMTALQLADSIQDEDTRNKVKEYIQTRIVPSGNPERDFRDALGVVSSSKNQQVIEEISRYTTPRTVAPGGTIPPKHEEEFVPTAEEARFMRPPYNLSKEQIIKNRKQR